VFITQANGSGTFGETLSTPEVGYPNVGHTDTFLSIGKFETQIEAENCQKYIFTKFARALLGALKVTQNNPKGSWAKIPLQDFTESSEIDWSKDISDIDRQLYDNYKLSKEEREFIEKNVQPMG
jgi:type II restriction enzyme